MTPEQSLEILDNAVALAPLTRRDHVLAQQALAVLREALAKSPATNDPQPE